MEEVKKWWKKYIILTSFNLFEQEKEEEDDWDKKGWITVKFNVQMLNSYYNLSIAFDG